MEAVKYLLVGAGLAAVSAARQIAKHEPSASMLIVNDEANPPYDRPPLSKSYLLSTAFEDIRYPAAELGPNAVVRSGEVIRLDAGNHVAELLCGSRVQFDKCLLATGGRPRSMTVAGSHLKGVHLFRTARDAERLAAGAKPGRRCVIVGAGFIGLELAATLTQMGVAVHVVETQSMVWPQFGDIALSSMLEKYCARRGIEFHLKSSVLEFRGKGDGVVSSVALDNGSEIDCDFAAVCIGIVPNVELAQKAGISVDNGIVVDSTFQTSLPGIYAAGDVCNFMDESTGRRRRIEHWGHAEHSGQVAGQSMVGLTAKYSLLNYVWSEIFELRIDYAGYHHDSTDRAVRGELGSQGSCVFYLKDQALAAYCAVNAPQRDLAVYNRLIKSANQVDVERLTDTSADLRRLLASVK